MFVRLAIESDVEQYVELARLAVDESARHLGFNPDKVRATFRRYIDEARPTIFVVDDKRSVIGFLNAYMNEYDFADGIFTIQHVLFVDPNRRGTRAAALLMNEFVRWSDMLGAKENVGGNDNGLYTEKTTRFLKRFGFEKSGDFLVRIGKSQ